MISYPYIGYSRSLALQPLISGLVGDPLIVSLGNRSPFLEGMAVRDQRELQRRLDARLRGEHAWGLAGYLENRERLLADCPRMVREKRFYHLGLDILVPFGTSLHAPLDANVTQSGYEEGEGNYGGYVLLRHEHPRLESFYSFYGHLQRTELPEAGRGLTAGEAFARIGDFQDNGHWFHHVHLQILTRKGLDEGYLSLGYCTANDLRHIAELCPSPLPLFTI